MTRIGAVYSNESIETRRSKLGDRCHIELENANGLCSRKGASDIEVSFEDKEKGCKREAGR